MRKEYRSSNVRFCMDDENQRRTWEYLQSITRKEGSYGKILSDAFVQILDGNHAIEQEALQQNLSECVTEKMLSMQLSTLKRELLEEMEVYMEMPYLLLHRPEIIEMRWNKKQQECRDRYVECNDDDGTCNG